MSVTKECGGCEFFRKMAGRKTGTCHAAPPVPIMVGMGHNPVNNEPIPVILTYWPELGVNDFCGSFVPSRGTLSKIDLTKLADVNVEGQA